MTLNIKDKTLAQAIKMLDALQVQYKVIGFDGVEYGALEVIPPKKKKIVRSRHFAATGYIEKLKAMQVGDVIELVPPDGDRPEQLRAAITGTANRLFGGGNATTHCTKELVQVMRLA
jgi:hypothetical protein